MFFLHKGTVNHISFNLTDHTFYGHRYLFSLSVGIYPKAVYTTN